MPPPTHIVTMPYALCGVDSREQVAVSLAPVQPRDDRGPMAPPLGLMRAGSRQFLDDGEGCRREGFVEFEDSDVFELSPASLTLWNGEAARVPFPRAVARAIAASSCIQPAAFVVDRLATSPRKWDSGRSSHSQSAQLCRLKLEDIAVFELNEAFAAQSSPSSRKLASIQPASIPTEAPSPTVIPSLHWRPTYSTLLRERTPQSALRHGDDVRRRRHGGCGIFENLSV